MRSNHMPKVEQIDIRAIFEKATGHKLPELSIRVYPVEPKQLAELPPTE
jgi:hypothetical protein